MIKNNVLQTVNTTLTNKSSGLDRGPSCESRVVSWSETSVRTQAGDTLPYTAVCVACGASLGCRLS